MGAGHWWRWQRCVNAALSVERAQGAARHASAWRTYYSPHIHRLAASSAGQCTPRRPARMDKVPTEAVGPALRDIQIRFSNGMDAAAEQSSTEPTTRPSSASSQADREHDRRSTASSHGITYAGQETFARAK